METTANEILTENKMGVMPVNKLLLSMSIPMMVSMLIQALYNIVDSIFVAQISEDALTAVSLVFPVQTVMMAVSTGTCVGVNAILSKRLGEKRYEEANKTANIAVMLSVLSYLVFLLIGIFCSEIFFKKSKCVFKFIFQTIKSKNYNRRIVTDNSKRSFGR